MNKPALLTITLIISCTMFIPATGLQAQTTWYVDDDAPQDPGPGDPSTSDPLEDGSAGHPFDAIQEGIDAASGGETVLVLDGNYRGTGNRDVDFKGKAITVRSENGAEQCVINCMASEMDPHRGFYFHSGEGTDALLQGFTIKNGYVFGADEDSHRGGGIYCSNQSSPTICNNIIIDNTARYGHSDGLGGGIDCNASSPVITGNIVSGNFAHEDGGGISCMNSTGVIISDNTISGNEADYHGDGIHCYSSSLEITGNTINNNLGDGIYCIYSLATGIRYNTISENEKDGIYSTVSNGTLTITGNTISGNMTGGISAWAAEVIITDNLITDNFSGYRGGGIMCRTDFATITGNTILRNTVYGYEDDPYPGVGRGGGIYVYNSHEEITISDNIIKYNIADGRKR